MILSRIIWHIIQNDKGNLFSHDDALFHKLNILITILTNNSSNNFKKTTILLLNIPQAGITKIILGSTKKRNPIR